METGVVMGGKVRKYELRKSMFHRAVVLSVLILLTAVTCANASPTITVNDRIRSSGHAAFSQIPHILETFESANSGLIIIGKEITKPNIASAISSGAKHDNVALLPAVPTAVAMALVGLLCVSLVRGRSLLAAALICILPPRLAGFQMVPQLTHLCAQTPRNRGLIKLANTYLFANTIRARCDIEGSRYIGLVKYLTGIPNSIPPVYDAVSTFAKTKHQLQLHQCFITTMLFYPVSALSRAVSISGANIHFKSVFIAQTFPRGPPVSASLQFELA